MCIIVLVFIAEGVTFKKLRFHVPDSSFTNMRVVFHKLYIYILAKFQSFVLGEKSQRKR